MPTYLIKAQGTPVGIGLLQEQRANDARTELELCLAVPVFPQWSSVYGRTLSHEPVWICRYSIVYPLH